MHKMTRQLFNKMPERNVISTKDHAFEDSQALSPVLQMGRDFTMETWKEAQKEKEGWTAQIKPSHYTTINVDSKSQPNIREGIMEVMFRYN
ncbi:hypothetical protein CFP56_036383 [Quercus suber]|uniref:Uncharacterized protein n=1 Tax=Quercus suber TaxID=58331 RepID=A0AAW0LPG5_QUESU